MRPLPDYDAMNLVIAVQIRCNERRRSFTLLVGVLLTAGSWVLLEGKTESLLLARDSGSDPVTSTLSKR